MRTSGAEGFRALVRRMASRAAERSTEKKMKRKVRGKGRAKHGKLKNIGRKGIERKME